LQSSLYLQDKISLLNNKIFVNAGFRVTHFDVTNKIYPEPRLSLTFEPVPKFKIKSAWGFYNQFLTRIIREDVLQGSKDFWLLSDDESVAINSSIHYILGCSYDNKNYLFEIEGFYKNLKGLTEYSMRNTGNPMRRNQVAASEEYFFKGNGYSKGIEFLIQKKFGNSTGWIAYTLSEVKHTYPDLNNGIPYFALHDQTHELKTVFMRHIKQWDLSAAFIYATGKPYTAPESEYQLTLLDGSVYNYIHVSEKNSYRLPDYHHLDISASYNWKGFKAENVLSFSVFNVYNRKNVWYKEFNINENEVTVTDMNLLGFTPNISFTVKF
jgi:ferric enterobactin receptor